MKNLNFSWNSSLAPRLQPIPSNLTNGGKTMIVTKEAKSFLQSIQRFLPEPATTSYGLEIHGNDVRIIPMSKDAMVTFLYDGETLIAGIALDSEEKLQGRTLILNTYAGHARLELLERRRAPRTLCA